MTFDGPVLGRSLGILEGIDDDDGIILGGELGVEVGVSTAQV